ncbi:MAG TPA: AAA family ATPase [Gaiellaceae bacterium]|nr:AAA family ATPase [Gaiellaceae bacterium]
MLRRLRIENLVLIREADIEPGKGLNAITGETGAGKTILAQAIGLLLGAKGDATLVGPGAEEAYVEAEFEVPAGLLEEEELEALTELKPEDEDGLVVARRVFADGRTRAYAWGRSAAREDLAAAAERLIAMSGQFEQRRLARPSYQLDVLDAFVGEDQLRLRAELRAAWRQLGVARRRHEELSHGAAAEESRLAELRALVEDTEGLTDDAEDSLRAERERLRHVAELAEAVNGAVAALTPDEGDGASAFLGQAERSLAAVSELAPELASAAAELRDAELRLNETVLELRRFRDSLQAEPDRLEQVESELERIADAKRRFRCESYAELLARAAEARAELSALENGADPLEAAAAALTEAENRAAKLADRLSKNRRAAAEPFASAVEAELHGVGLGEGEFRTELGEREPTARGRDEVSFLIRPNQGLSFAPVAETASGGELSRIALALAAVAGGETMVFDEIDAGIGGETAHSVGETLRRLAERAQVITITHLPQIATVADRHFSVEKIPGDPTHTRIEQLDEEGRQEEVRRMLGGQEFLQTVR